MTFAAISSAGCSATPRTPAPLVPSRGVVHFAAQAGRSCPKAIDHTVVFGLTDISAATGNESLTAAENCQGTITVLRWPSPGYDNQIRYTSWTKPGVAAQPNEGSFLGVVTHGSTLWLAHGFSVVQSNPDPLSDAVESTYTRPGMTVTVTDVVEAGSDILARHVAVSPPTAASAVIGFAHFDVMKERLAAPA